MSSAIMPTTIACDNKNDEEKVKRDVELLMFFLETSRVVDSPFFVLSEEIPRKLIPRKLINHDGEA